ncbi:MAG: helix-turn-helix domain-containing protein [Candidatus Aenigmatarchaeota archaeon]
MLRENLIHGLKEFGMSEYEAKAYLALTVHGPLPASSVSDFSKIPQSKVYEVLKSLNSKCLADYWNGKPLRYKAVEPSFAFNRMINQRKMKIDSLKEKSDELIKELKPFKEKGFSSWTSKGKVAWLEKASGMITNAKRIGIAMTSNFSRYHLLDEACIRAYRKGIKIKILCVSELDKDKIARASWYLNHGAEIRVLPLNVKLTMGLVDDIEVCVRVDNNSQDSDVFWSNNPALVKIFKSHFNDLWSRAKKFHARK